MNVNEKAAAVNENSSYIHPVNEEEALEELERTFLNLEKTEKNIFDVLDFLKAGGFSADI